VSSVVFLRACAALASAHASKTWQSAERLLSSSQHLGTGPPESPACATGKTLRSESVTPRPVPADAVATSVVGRTPRKGFDGQVWQAKGEGQLDAW
jgi:hypothetical protein